MRHAAWAGLLSLRLCGAALLSAALLGCERTPTARFELNFEGRVRADYDREVQQQWVDVLDGLFGQPDKPFVRPEAKLDLAKIALASGPVSNDGWLATKKDGTVYAGPIVGDSAKEAAAPASTAASAPASPPADLVLRDYELGEVKLAAAEIKSKHPQRGLYRQHCVHCHGVTGGGDGPTAAFLNPYPRDFRKGVYKFITNTRDYTASRADLKKTLQHGLPGSSMPSFALLPEKEQEALVEYVVYLSLRGQVEEYLVPALEADEFDPALLIEEGLDGAVGRWKNAEKFAVKIADPPKLSREEKVAKGKELYVKVKCNECHGPAGLGDGQPAPGYDMWNLPKTTVKPPVPDKDGKVKPGPYFALPAQSIRPRNLRSGVYRGGRRPADLFTRIFNGIGPSGMSGFGKKPGVPAPLSDDDIWCLVEYVRSLPYDAEVMDAAAVHAAEGHAAATHGTAAAGTTAAGTAHASTGVGTDPAAGTAATPASTGGGVK